MIKKSQLKSNIDIGERFQTVMLENHESHEIKHFYHQELQENKCDLGYQWRDDERNYKNIPTSRKVCHHYESFDDAPDWISD